MYFSSSPSTSAAAPDVELLALLGDQLGDAVVCLDARQRPGYANAAAVRLFGAAAADGEVSLLASLPAAARSVLTGALDRVATHGVVEQLGPLPALEAGHALAGRPLRLVPLPHGAALIVPAAAGGASEPAAAPIPSISDIVRQLNQSLEVERVVSLVARHAAELLGAYGAAVFMLDDDAIVVVGRHGEHMQAIGTRIPLDESMSGQAIRTQRCLRLTDIDGLGERWPHLRTAATGAPRPNAIAVPLLIGGRAIGAICVFGQRERDFEDRDESLLIKLADHAAVAVENARLYSAAARTARHASTLAAVARELAVNVTPAAVYAGVARVATESLGAAGVRIFLADPATRHVEVAYSQLGDDAVLAQIVANFWQWWPGQVLRAGEPRFEADLALAARADGALPAAPGVQALALLPLLIEGQPRGLLAVRWARPQRFDEQERLLLADFASQVSVAMRNASLVETLERRAARLAAVTRAQQALPRTALHEVHDELHRAVAAVVPAPSFAFLALDDESGAPQPVHVVVDGAPMDHAGIAPPPDWPVADAARAGQPLLEHHPLWSWSACAPPQPGREWRPAAAGLAVPVRHGTRVIGVLHVQSPEPLQYDQEDAELLAVVAQQAGAALEIARLFTTQREERDLAEASATIARVALGASDLHTAADALLAAIADVLPSGGKLLSVASDGMLDYLAGDGAGRAFVGRRLPLEESLVRSRNASEAIRLESVREAVHPDHRAGLPDIPVLLVPLVARQRILGTLLIGPRAETWNAPESAETTFPPALVARYQQVAVPLALALDALLLGEAERRRVERERMLATALATMDQPVLVLAPDGTVRYANRAALREYGYEPAEIDGLPVTELAPGTPVEAAPAGLEPGATQFIGTGGPAAAAHTTLHHVHRRRDGSEFPVAVTRGTIRGDDGVVAGLVLGVRNLTEERRVAEQLRQHEKLAALGSLVAGVAHELNNPLTGISAFSQLLLEEELGETQVESVRLIKREADRAVGVIRDLLLFSRKSDAHLGAVDVNALLQLTVRLRTYSLRAEEITPVLELDPTLPRALGDEQRLQQVLLNLVVNAEYAMHGRAQRRLTLRTRRADAGRLLVEVTDTGAGMDSETLRHAFEPFFTTKPAGVGTGLGLSVSYGIVQAHGGTIDVASHPGRGTTFSIHLPSAAPSGAPRA